APEEGRVRELLNQPTSALNVLAWMAWLTGNESLVSFDHLLPGLRGGGWPGHAAFDHLSPFFNSARSSIQPNSAETDAARVSNSESGAVPNSTTVLAPCSAVMM